MIKNDKQSKSKYKAATESDDGNGDSRVRQSRIARAGIFRLLKLNAENVIDELAKSIYD